MPASCCLPSGVGAVRGPERPRQTRRPACLCPAPAASCAAPQYCCGHPHGRPDRLALRHSGARLQIAEASCPARFPNCNPLNETLHLSHEEWKHCSSFSET
ncbi:hypothetical protein PAHAL_9G138100 [Panicum hallii]|uniref:Uncharacterized protein n=1 Tax=Panicum hallii TaxID=206008 RepID=A0A2S3IJZ4_9POAL|nr:hypothetical protein PAHAL_9G138100 [Panicum hallii]